MTKTKLLADKLRKLEAKRDGAQEAANELADIYTLTRATDLAHIRHAPPPRRIFGDFFFENDLCLMFSAANSGKSVLAVQLADAISRGEPCEGFPNEVGAQPVIYFDYELTDKQFFNRYVNETDREQYYRFHPNFWRAGVKYPKAKSAKAAAEKLLLGLRECVANSPAKILIIDNLTRIAGDITEGAAAFEIMSYLDQLKKDGYSILVLGHTKKGNHDKFGISADDILGSSLINNFLDAGFCIGRNASNPSARYLKQTKVRNGKLNTDVFVFELEKRQEVFLKLSYRGVASEAEQTQALSEEERKGLETEIKIMHRDNPAMSLNAIARQINDNGNYKQKIYATTVQRILKKAEEAARVEAAERAANDAEDADQMPF